MRVWLTLIFTTACFFTQAQETDSVAVEEDFSMYADAELAGDGKRFCTSKVFDLSPNKLISVGYDFQTGAHLKFGSWGAIPTSDVSINNVQGIRIAGNFPVLSRTNILLNLGVNYWESNFSIDNAGEHPLAQRLQERGLRTTGITTTLFKPFNEKKFSTGTRCF